MDFLHRLITYTLVSITRSFNTYGEVYKCDRAFIESKIHLKNTEELLISKGVLNRVRPPQLILTGSDVVYDRPDANNVLAPIRVLIPRVPRR